MATPISYDDTLLNNCQDENKTPISDENLALELQLQEAIGASLRNSLNDTATQKTHTFEIGVCEIRGEIKANCRHDSFCTSNHVSTCPRVGCTTEIRACEEALPRSLCQICAEGKGKHEMFPLHCDHDFCTDCISRHVTIMIQKWRAEGGAAVVTCPAFDCTCVLDTDTLRAVLTAEVVSVWDDVLCESLIAPTTKYYCPYKDCSGLLVRENGDGEVIRESECPYCHRLFCATCNVAWHAGVGCNEREKEAEVKFHDLAKKRKWQRCPNCKFYVEKKEGCLHMTCRCRCQFCYTCGKDFTSAHGGCA